MNVKPAVRDDTAAPATGRPTDAPDRTVAGLQQLLVALADPVRLEMVRRLMNAAEPVPCAQLYDGINKSTATHHFRTLREAGLTERLMIDGHTYQLLRAADVEQAAPGLLASVVTSANREAAG